MQDFTPDEPFYIGELNIYGYQATGFRRWNTWRASLRLK